MNKFLSEVVEQEKAKDILGRICESRRVPHAFLFYGKEGVGKFNTAIQFVKMLNSKNSQTDSGDIVLHKISSLQEPYVKLIFQLPRGKGEGADDSSFEKLSKDVVENIAIELKNKSANPYYKIIIEEANTIKISSIREIRKFISIQLDEIEYRAVIILDAHLMNDQSQNALLKNLEEPPEGIIFILITSDKDKLLHTIQSRCWIIDFEPLTEPSIAKILRKHFQIDEELSAKVSHFADGSVTEAVTLASSEFESTLEKTISVLRYSLAKRYNSAFKELVSFLNENSDDAIRLLIRMIKTWIGDVVKNKFERENYYFEKYTDTMVKFNARFGSVNLSKIYSILDMLDDNYSKKVNLNVLSLNLIFELSSLSIGN